MSRHECCYEFLHLICDFWGQLHEEMYDPYNVFPIVFLIFFVVILDLKRHARDIKVLAAEIQLLRMRVAYLEEQQNPLDILEEDKADTNEEPAEEDAEEDSEEDSAEEDPRVFREIPCEDLREIPALLDDASSDGIPDMTLDDSDGNSAQSSTAYYINDELAQSNTLLVRRASI